MPTQIECQQEKAQRRKKLDTEQIRAALQDRNLLRVSQASVVNYWTLLRFASGKRTARAHTLDKLRAYIQRYGLQHGR